MYYTPGHSHCNCEVDSAVGLVSLYVHSLVHIYGHCVLDQPTPDIDISSLSLSASIPQREATETCYKTSDEYDDKNINSAGQIR